MKIFGRILAFLVVFVAAQSAQAQQRGQWLLGSLGMTAGTPPPSGFYYSQLVTFYNTDTLKTSTGQKSALPDTSLHVDQNIFIWSSDMNLLGGRYTATLIVPILKSNLEFNPISLTGGSGLGDLYLSPIGVGWKFQGFDLSAALGLILPAGSYSFANFQNTGRGQWSLLPSLGGTAYFDEGRMFFFSLMSTVEVPFTDRRDTSFRQGLFLDLEYGLGMNIMEGFLQIGAAGYAGFQISDGTVPIVTPNLDRSTRIMGLGPQLNINVPIRSDLLVSLTIRDYFEFNGRSTSQGNSLFAGIGLKF